MTASTDRFDVLVDDTGTAGLHPAGAAAPRGWRHSGFTGTETDCIRWVDICAGRQDGE